MVSRTLVDAWKSWTHFRSAQEYMDDSRIRGRETIGAAVDSYVIEIPAMNPGWAGLNAEELEDIRDLLMSYLFLTQGVEWN